MPENNEKKSLFALYRRKGTAEARPFVEGETLDEHVSISSPDRAAGSPKVGDMIARNPENFADEWLISGDYFATNFEPFENPELAHARAACEEIEQELRIARERVVMLERSAGR